MPTPNQRPSLSKDLLTRYGTQRAGGAFEVKDTLKSPGSSPVAGTVINANSIKGATFQSPNGFEVKMKEGITQLKDAQSSPSLELSRFLKGFDRRKYHR